MPDIIQRLRELRQSSQSSVVTGIEPEGSELRPSIEHPVEAWLISTILEQLTNPGGPAISLLVLAGNAGDGKSFLLRQLRRRLEREEGLSPTMARWLLDATESSRQSERAVDRLDEFFAPFSDDASWNPDRLHIVAMNTGTVVGFVSHDQERKRFRALCDILSLQLGIRAFPEAGETDSYAQRFDRVLVVDLDRRNLIPLDLATRGFVDEMLDTLVAEQGGYLHGAETRCSQCVHSDRCPIGVNLLAIRHSRVRARLKNLLLDIALEDRIHISPRSLWHLAYQLTVGGLDAASIAEGKPLRTCADIAEIDDEMRAKALFFTAIFDKANDSIDSGGPALFAELDRIDPAKRFTVDMHECALSAGLSPQDDLRLCTETAGDVGIEARLLKGSDKNPRARASAAVRRAFFFSEAEPDPIRHKWLLNWCEALAEHRRDVLGATATRSEVVLLMITVLKDIYAAKEQPGYWRLNLPWKNLISLFAPLSLQPGKKRVRPDARVLGPDTYRAGGLRQVSAALSEKLGVYPLHVPVPLKDGPDVRVTWSIYRLLRRVADQGYVAGSLDPELVQNLDRIGSSLGAQAAVKDGVVVFTSAGTMHCTDDGQGGYDVVKL